jgi:hypothetical protein
MHADKFHQGVPADHFDKAGRYIFADPEIARMAGLAKATGATMAAPTWASGGAAPSSADWISLATDSKGTWVAIAYGTATMYSVYGGANNTNLLAFC